MPETTNSEPTQRLRFRGRGWLVIALLVVAPIASYWNSRYGPFVFDDGAAILENASLRTLWPLGVPLSPPTGGLPVGGRPLANFSFALNYALSREAVWSYHALNVALHVLAGLALFGVLRRTLARPVVPVAYRPAADGLALAIAALWVMHPLQTAAVTYVSQRTEILATLCYLLTLLAFARAAEAATAGARRGWAMAAVVACLAGMASKETVVSAPLIVLLYDRTFWAGSCAEAWRRRRWLHLALASTWCLLAWLVGPSASRGGTAGWGLAMSPLAYLITQGEAIAGYLGRVVWPYPLIFDYGEELVPLGVRSGLGLLLVAGLVGLTLWALRRKPPAGFAGAVFFAVLAPSSSVVPVVTQTIAEHRMYLPLAVALTGLVLGAYTWLGRRAWLAAVAAGGVAGGLVAARNNDYASAERLWRDTVEKRPENVRAHNNLAASLLELGRTGEGRAELEVALRLKPDAPDVLRNLGQAELNAGDLARALPLVERAQEIDPSSAAGWVLLGQARLQAGQPAAAAEACRRAIRLRPDLVSAHLGLGEAQMAHEDCAGAAEAYGTARRLRPESVDIAFRLGVALFQAERDHEALALFDEVRARQPDYPGLRLHRGAALIEAGKPAAALTEFDTLAIVHEPPTVRLLYLRALALAQLGRRDEAAAAVREALKLEPNYAPAVELARDLERTNG